MNEMVKMTNINYFTSRSHMQAGHDDKACFCEMEPFPYILLISLKQSKEKVLHKSYNSRQLI